MSFIDDLTKATALLDKEWTALNQSRAINEASKNAEGLRLAFEDGEMNEKEFRSQQREQATQLSQQLQGLGASVGQQQQAISNFGPEAAKSGNQNIAEAFAGEEIDEAGLKRGIKQKRAEETVRISEGEESRKAAKEIATTKANGEKVKAEAKTREVKNSLRIPGLKATEFASTDKKDLRDLREATSQFNSLSDKIGQLQTMFAETGFATFGAERGRADSLARSIQTILKGPAFVNLGVLTGPDLALLEEIAPSISQGPFRRLIPEPGLKAELTAKLQQLGKSTSQDFTNKAKSRGFGIDRKSDVGQNVFNVSQPPVVRSELKNYASRVEDEGRINDVRDAVQALDTATDVQKAQLIGILRNRLSKKAVDDILEAKGIKE